MQGLHSKSSFSLTRVFNAIRSNPLFEIIVVGVILFSALLAGAKTYDIPPTFLNIVVWLDYSITVFFLVEISIRFLLKNENGKFFKSGWNIFDSLIVIVSLIQIEDSELALSVV